MTFGKMFARSIVALIVTLASCGAFNEANLERKDPIGVRHALRIITS